MSSAIVDLMRALDFAARKHSDQRRKGAAAEPYINHLAQVARLLAEATGGHDVVLVVAGLLHDAIEDTDTTLEELVAAFGPEVAAQVAEVSDDKTLPQSERKRLQAETARRKSTRAKMIKLADKTSNLQSLIDSPPVSWDIRRRRDYLAWTREVMEGCRGVNSELEAWFDEAYQTALSRLKDGNPR